MAINPLSMLFKLPTFPLTAPVVPGALPAAPVPVAPATSKLTVADFQAYINAVDNGGNVNQGKIKAGAADIGEARNRIIEGYAAEFVLGGRIESAEKMKEAADLLNAALTSSNPNAKSAAQFALVASRYKNAGGNYNNGKIANILKKTGNADLVKGGVGNTDVETLNAVVNAIARGTLKISDVYDGTGADAVNDDAKYKRAIDAVLAGDLGSNIENANKKAAGNAGDAGNAGNAGKGAYDKDAGNAGNANPGNAGNAGDAKGGNAAAKGTAGTTELGKAAGAAPAAPPAASATAGTAGTGGTAGTAGNSIYSILQYIIQLLMQLLGGGAGGAPNAFTGNLATAGTAAPAAKPAAPAAGAPAAAVAPAGPVAGNAGNAGNAAGGY